MPLLSQSIGQLGPFAVDTVQNIDCVQGLKALPDCCVDIAIVDPPYNASKGGIWKWDNSVHLPGLGGNWEKVSQEWDNMHLHDYLLFSLALLSELKRVVKPTGSFWVHGTYHNAGIINFALQLLEVEIINEVVWYKRNSFPNLSGRRLTASHETILWAHTGKQRKYLFNYELSKQMNCPEDALKVPNKQMRTVWDIPNNKSREELQFGRHPTQKPLRLIMRMLALSSKPHQICLIPFGGGGSECVAAIKQGLHFLSFETDPKFVKMSKERIALAKSSSELRLDPLRHTDKQIPSAKLAEGKNLRKKELGPIPSLIKWSGSKRSQAYKIAELIPTHNTYLEPFLGGGAVLFLTAKAGAIAGDIYRPLIDLWKIVQERPNEVIEHYSSEWQALHRNFPSHFYLVRERFNTTPNALDLNFLMRTCVNGIVRFNDAGKFNNSFHLSRPGMKPTRFADIVLKWSERIQGVHFLCQDYRATLARAREGDFVYLDPPYAGTKQRYSSSLILEELVHSLAELNQKGVKWAFSFDGARGTKDFSQPIPQTLYVRHFRIMSGNSPVGKVLNGPIEKVHESLYLNY